MKKKLFISIILLSSLIRLFTIHPTFADENLYFNIASNLGYLDLYHDMFSAQPPLHIYILNIFFQIFGTNLIAGKLLPFLTSTFSGVFVYLIARKLFNETSAMISMAFFLFSVPMLVFSTVAYGMFTAACIFLVSFYLLLKGKVKSSMFVFSVSIFYRYLMIAGIIPFLIFNRKLKDYKHLILSVFLIFISLTIIYGASFIRSTITYHILLKSITQEQISSEVQVISQNETWNYLNVNLTFICLALAFIAITKNWRWGIIPIIIDLMIFLVFRLFAYHYFILSLPFYAVLIGSLIYMSPKDFKLLFLVFIIFSFLFNMRSVEFAYTTDNRLEELALYIAGNIDNNETIFGDQVLINYVSFKTGVRITGNHFDSDPQHLVFEPSIISDVIEQEPRYVILNEFSSSQFSKILENYDLRISYGGFPRILVYSKR